VAETLCDRVATDVEVSVVMPCLNEEESLGYCIKEATKSLDSMGINYEIVVSDNGSTDRSVEIAESLGARVAHQPIRGYGNAYHKGISEAAGRYVVIADSDGTYPLSEIPAFVELLRGGADMVMGSRRKGTIEPGAMPWLHRYVGNPVLTGILNLMFHTRITDAHCGMRGFTKDAYAHLDLQTGGMEYASEMVIQAGRKNLSIEEVPITLRPRIGGEPKLDTWHDGWRHLRFMLLEAPNWVLLLPGIVLVLVGAVILGTLSFGPIYIGNVLFDVNAFVFGALVMVLGVQTVLMGLTVKFFAKSRHFDESRGIIGVFDRWFTLERGLVAGGAVLALGFVPAAYLAAQRVRGSQFDDTNLRLSVLALVLIVVGAQIIFQSVFLSMLRVTELASNWFIRPPSRSIE
jgi:glycosyltransferase involved in cell wall biosynthesis